MPSIHISLNQKLFTAVVKDTVTGKSEKVQLDLSKVRPSKTKLYVRPLSSVASHLWVRFNATPSA